MKKQKTETKTLKCTKCQQEKSIYEFSGWANGRPSYRCVPCANDDRIRAGYKARIRSSPIEESEIFLHRQFRLADIFEEELEAYKAETNPAAAPVTESSGPVDMSSIAAILQGKKLPDEISA